MNGTIKVPSLLTQSLLVGGWSLIAAALLLVADFLRLSTSLPLYEGSLALFFTSLAWLVNYPHAIWSYRLAYQQGNQFILKNALALLVLPCILIIWALCAVTYWNSPVGLFPHLINLEKALEPYGIFLNYSLYPSLGPFLFGNFIVLQMIALGRHYVLQSFGISLQFAQKSAYPLTESQRKWVRANLLSLWLVNLLWGYTVFSPTWVMGFQYFHPRLPSFLLYVSLWFFAVTLAGVLYFVWFVNWKRYRRNPPWVAVVTLASTYVWMQPWWWTYGYQLWLVPLAHCIQYLYFCYFVERGNAVSQGILKMTRPLIFRLVVVSLVVMGAGYLTFEVFPDYLQRGLSSSFPAFVMVAVNSGVNIHHYFIDGVIWRNRSSLTRKHLQFGFQFA